MGKCCSKASAAAANTDKAAAPAEPAAPFEIVTNPAARDTPVPEPVSVLRDGASQTTATIHKPVPQRLAAPPLVLNSVPPETVQELPDVPTTPVRRIVTPNSPWEITDGV